MTFVSMRMVGNLIDRNKIHLTSLRCIIAQDTTVFCKQGVMDLTKFWVSNIVNELTTLNYTLKICFIIFFYILLYVLAPRCIQVNLIYNLNKLFMIQIN